MLISEWLNSLNDWQQVIVGAPYAIIIGYIFARIFLKNKNYPRYVKC